MSSSKYPETHLLPSPWTIEYIEPTLQVIRGEDFSIDRFPFESDPTKASSTILGKGIKRLTIITHGFQSSGDQPWVDDIAEKIYYERERDLGGVIVIVDWSRGASAFSLLNYYRASANMIQVGIWLGDLLLQFKKDNPDCYIYGIGHSLGAHLMGTASRTSHKFNRITGLDPAGPLFERENEHIRLNKDDATLVDVIHTDGYTPWTNINAWDFPLNHFGTLIPLGTIDFYPNFGIFQPNCGHLPWRVADSHRKAIQYYKDTIGQPGLYKTNCVLDGIPQYERPVEKVKIISEFAELGFYTDKGYVKEFLDSDYYFYQEIIEK